MPLSFQTFSHQAFGGLGIPAALYQDIDNNQDQAPLKPWYAMVNGAEWVGPSHIKPMFGSSVDIVRQNHLIPGNSETNSALT